MTVINKIKEELKKTLGLLNNDGTQPQIQVSDMVVGGKVEVVNPDGTLSPAPDGEYTVDKDVIEVKDGQITSVNGAEETAPADKKAPEEKMAAPDMQSEIDALKAETESLKAAIAELKKAIEDDKAEDAAEDQKMSAEFSKQISDLNETLKVLAAMPSEFSKTNQSPIVQDVKEAKILAASNLWSNRK